MAGRQRNRRSDGRVIAAGYFVARARRSPSDLIVVPEAVAAPGTPAPPDGLPLGQRRRAYLALGAATALGVIDGTIANTALPTIGLDLHATPAQSVWVINAFQVAVTMSLFAFAAFGQARGLSRAFRIGLLIFTLGSACSALSHSLPALVASRFFQGLGASALMALGPALLRHIFPRAQLGRAVGVNGLVVATSIAAGPTVGGAILVIAPWPWLFWINVPIGIAIMLLARGAFPRDEGHRGVMDVPSFAASALGFGGIVYGIDGFARGEARVLAVLELVVGLAAFAWFIRRQRTLAQPMFAVDLFRRPLFSLSSSTSFLGFIAWGLAFVSLPFLFQLQFGATPLESGLLLSAWPAVMAALAPVAGHLSDRYPASVLSTTGLVIYGLGLGLYAFLPAHPSTLEIVVRSAICGLGCGLYQTPNSRELMGSAPREKASSASAMLAAMRVSGQTVGVALVAVVFTAVGSGGEARVALLLAAAFALLGATSSLSRRGFPRYTHG